MAAGRLALAQADLPAGVASLEDSLALAQSADDEEGILAALAWLGIALLHEQRHLHRAAVFLEECWCRAQASGNKLWGSYAPYGLGQVAMLRGDREGATARFEECLTLTREVGSPWNIAHPLIRLAQLAVVRGDLDRAAEFAAESLRLRWQIRDRRGVAWCLEMLATVDSARGAADRAAQLFGAAEVQRELLGVSLLPLFRAECDRGVAAARAALGEAAFMAAWQAGRVLPLDRAVALALPEGAAL